MQVISSSIRQRNTQTSLAACTTSIPVPPGTPAVTSHANHALEYRSETTKAAIFLLGPGGSLDTKPKAVPPIDKRPVMPADPLSFHLRWAANGTEDHCSER